MAGKQNDRINRCVNIVIVCVCVFFAVLQLCEEQPLISDDTFADMVEKAKIELVEKQKQQEAAERQARILAVSNNTFVIQIFKEGACGEDIGHKSKGLGWCDSHIQIQIHIQLCVKLAANILFCSAVKGMIPGGFFF